MEKDPYANWLSNKQHSQLGMVGQASRLSGNDRQYETVLKAQEARNFG